jgi:protein-S-isoprenylcysteine O-methyltransferase Ste14
MLEPIHRLFNHPGLRKFLVKLRVPIFILAGLGVIAFMDPRYMAAGFAASMAGELIQLWCFATLDKNQRLCCRGPYAVVRNPMYLGRFLITFGPLLALGIWWLLALFVVVYWFYMLNRVKREEELLRGVLGAEYLAYCTAVRRFLPGKRFRNEPLWVWDWDLFRRNHGPKNLVALLAFWLAAFSWHTIFSPVA